jgi:hypothetical protein
VRNTRDKFSSDFSRGEILLIQTDSTQLKFAEASATFRLLSNDEPTSARSVDLQAHHSTRVVKQNFSLPTLHFKVRSEWSECHNRAVICVRNLRSAQSELLIALIEVEERKVYYQLEVTSLYLYCVDVLGLPMHTAYDFIDVIRTSKTIPNLAKAVIEGRTTITKARRICSVITIENQKTSIDLACECTQKIIQKAVAMAKPRAAAPESLNYISGDVLQLTFAVSEEWSILLNDVKDLMSQKFQRAVSTEEVLFKLMVECKSRNDPVMKAKRAQSRMKDGSANRRIESAGAVAKKGTRREQSVNVEEKITRCEAFVNVEEKIARKRYRPLAIEHEVELRDQHQCVYTDRNGKRCASKRWLEKHHIREFAKGGEHSLENLETLCSAHHRMRHHAGAHVN